MANNGGSSWRLRYRCAEISMRRSCAAWRERRKTARRLGGFWLLRRSMTVQRATRRRRSVASDFRSSGIGCCGSMRGAPMACLTANHRASPHARQLALKSRVQILRRSRQPLLLCLEQAHRSALEDHVHRIAPMGARVLINGTWYKDFWKPATRLILLVAGEGLEPPTSGL